MTGWRTLSLYWRLLVSYLLVIAVASLTLYVASEALAPTFFGWHLEHVGWMAAMPHAAVPELEAALAGAHARAMQQAVLWGALASALVAGGLSLVIAGRIASPLRQMQRASRRIAAGNYHERLAVSTADEVGELAIALNDMARSLSESEARRVELLADVAHEFRTPLASLHGYLEGIEDGVFSPSPETLGACRRQLARLEHLVDDLSLLSRVEAGRERVEPVTVDVAWLLEHAAAAALPEFAAKGVALVVERLPRAHHVRADPERTGQVLANLLSNALRHTSEGGEVRLGVTRDPQSEAVVIAVQDTGEGVPPDALPHVFTRFFRADKARTSEGGGTGLGLTIAKHFVEAQRGRIGVESDPGRGARFWFTLPLADNEPHRG